MIGPRIGKDSNVINVNINFITVVKEVLHDLLSNVGGLFDSHWQAIVSVVAKGCTYGTKFLGRFIQFKSVVLHGHVKFGEVLVSISLLENIVDSWQSVDFAQDH
jgi:hypothetical protein